MRVRAEKGLKGEGYEKGLRVRAEKGLKDEG